MSSPLLTLDTISVSFGGVHALTGLSLSVGAGALHGLVGPNGAGKTTAMNVISGLVRPSSGSMRFAGEPFRPKPHRIAGNGLARTFQAPAVIDGLSVLENVLLGSHTATRAGIVACALRLPAAAREEQASMAKAQAALDQVGFALPHVTALADLSTWQRRQVEIARALMTAPKLLLLDEPAAGLTSGEVESLKSLLRRLCHGAAAILLIEHNVPLVFSLCDDVTAMADGRDIAHGPPAAVRRHPDVIRSYLGADEPRAAATARGVAPVTGKSVLTVEGVSSG